MLHLKQQLGVDNKPSLVIGWLSDSPSAETRKATISGDSYNVSTISNLFPFILIMKKFSSVKMQSCCLSKRTSVKFGSHKF